MQQFPLQVVLSFTLAVAWALGSVCREFLAKEK